MLCCQCFVACDCQIQNTPRLASGRPVTRAMERQRGRGTAGDLFSASCPREPVKIPDPMIDHLHKVCSAVTFLVFPSDLRMFGKRPFPRQLPGHFHLGRPLLRRTHGSGGQTVRHLHIYQTFQITDIFSFQTLDIAQRLTYGACFSCLAGP